MMVPIPVLIGYAIVIGSDSNGAGLFAMFLIAAGEPTPHGLRFLLTYYLQASIPIIPSSSRG